MFYLETQKGKEETNKSKFQQETIGNVAYTNKIMRSKEGVVNRFQTTDYLLIAGSVE